MSAGLRVLSAGPGATLQDSGRTGYLRFGVTEAGPMDELAHATANLLAGQPGGAAAVEIGVGGIELTAVDAAVTVGIAGGRFAIELGGRRLPPALRLRLEPGARLSVRAGEAGAWCYLAAAGGFDLPGQLGSLSTHIRSGIGGLHGRMLAPGDVLPLRQPRLLSDPAAGEAMAGWLDRPSGVVRVILGPQDDYFAADQIAAFFSTEWTVAGRSDRMAYMLEGPPLTHAKGFNIVSDGIALGAIQVPGEGRPIVLMADRQPTGGYPKIATVIRADLPRLAQLRSGETFRFARSSYEEAVAARRAEMAALAAPLRLEPLLRTELTSEFLLSHDLVDRSAA